MVFAQSQTCPEFCGHLRSEPPSVNSLSLSFPLSASQIKGKKKDLNFVKKQTCASRFANVFYCYDHVLVFVILFSHIDETEK